MDPGPQRRRRRLPRRLGLALAIAAGAVAILEGALRLAADDGPGWLFGPPHLEVTLATDPTAMPGVEGPATTRLNRLGLRADGERAGRSPRILCLGGSTTECAALDQEEAWPHLLQERLGGEAWVGAAAFSGATSRSHVVQMERAREADLVLCLVGVNDLALALERGEQHRAAGLADPTVRAEVERRVFFERPRDLGWWPPRRTAIGRRVERFRRTRWARASAARDLPDRYRRWRSLRAAARPHRERLPDLTSPLAEYRRNLRAMCALARERGLEPVFLTQPVLWRPELAPALEALLWFGWVGRAPAEGVPDGYHSTANLAEGMARYDAALRAVGSSEGVRVIDLAAEMNGDPRWFYDDCHFNEAGARRVVELVHEGLDD